MAQSTLSVMRNPRFFPLFVTQFLSAFNDNFFKNALAIWITYYFKDTMQLSPQVLVTIAAGLFILPFFLFSSLAGQLADKYEKAFLIRILKVIELGIMMCLPFAFALHSMTLFLLILFGLGSQAAFFGPLKYAILPQHLAASELISGNAWIEAGTFIAILLGTIFGGLFILMKQGAIWISLLAIGFSILGWISSWFIPMASAQDPKLKLNFNILKESKRGLWVAFQKREFALCIFGISWFWFLGASYLTQFPSYVKLNLHQSPSVLTLFLSIFTIGISLGSLFCQKLLQGRVQATYVPLASIGMTLFGIDLVFATHHAHFDPVYSGVLNFLKYLAHWRILLDLLFIAICGGIYIVPLYTLLQHLSEEKSRARLIAANNIANALFMVASAIFSAIFLSLHFSVTSIFLFITLVNSLVSIYIVRLLPRVLVKSFFIWVYKLLYRVEVKGFEYYEQAGSRALIIANHTSYLDAGLLAAFLPDDLTFAIDTYTAKKFWVRFMSQWVNTFSIDPAHPLATKSLIQILQDNQRVVIFPEGRITVTGALMKIYEGPGLIADKADAPILPIRIDGAQYSPLSYLKGKLQIRWFPKITLTILPPVRLGELENSMGRERRKSIGNELFDLMSDMLFNSSNRHKTLFTSLIEAKKTYGKKLLILEDMDRSPIHYERLILGSIILGKKIARLSRDQEVLGFMLPNSIGAAVTFFAMQLHLRIPAMINFSAGIQTILNACHIASVKKIFTSHRFIENAKLEELENGLKEAGIQLFYLEDIRSDINLWDKLSGKAISYFAEKYYQYINPHFRESELSQRVAVILFTSGSEGMPKGVALSHENLQANRFQIAARVDFLPSDKVFNVLPMFHAFGLGAGTLLPILSGIRLFLYPSPLHYRVIPELCYSNNTTIFFGTDTFLYNYAKQAHPYDFYSMRYIFAGAEKIQGKTHAIWMNKFGIRLMEGYGATETAPVLSMNTAMQYRAGSVGRLLPGMRAKLEAVEGITQGKRLWVHGSNVMMGYLKENPLGVIQAPEDGWYDTGDIVEIDEDGFIFIVGRAKRFAKISGEMVSLTAIEEVLYKRWQQSQHGIISVVDEQKGERLILISTEPNLTVSDILEAVRQAGLSELGIPRKIIYITEMPVMGSGKIDYQTLQKNYGDSVLN